MEKEFVPYDLALKLKALGFNEPCFAYYNKEVNWNLCWKSNSVEPYNHNDITKYDSLSAPTFSQSFRWFREKYGYYISVFRTHDSNWGTDLWLLGVHKPKATVFGETYEEAELACLDKLIEIVEFKSEYDGIF